MVTALVNVITRQALDSAVIELKHRRAPCVVNKGHQVIEITNLQNKVT